MIKKINCVLLFFTVLWISCKQSTPVSNNSKPPISISTMETSINLKGTEGKILFVNIECFKNKRGEDTCVVMNTIEVDGKLKEGSSSSHSHGEEVNEYVCSLLSCDGQILYEEYIDNPLSKQMDTYEESGKIEHKEVNFERNEFSLRVQKKDANYCRLKIEKRKGNSTSIICNSTLKK